jgi:hypothetical protein
MGQDSDGVMGRHGDREKKIILLRIAESPVLRIFFVLAQYSNIIPVLQPVVRDGKNRN